MWVILVSCRVYIFFNVFQNKTHSGGVSWDLLFHNHTTSFGPWFLGQSTNSYLRQSCGVMPELNTLLSIIVSQFTSSSSSRFRNSVLVFLSCCFVVLHFPYCDLCNVLVLTLVIMSCPVSLLIWEGSGQLSSNNCFT